MAVDEIVSLSIEQACSNSIWKGSGTQPPSYLANIIYILSMASRRSHCHQVHQTVKVTAMPCRNVRACSRGTVCSQTNIAACISSQLGTDQQHSSFTLKRGVDGGIAPPPPPPPPPRAQLHDIDYGLQASCDFCWRSGSIERSSAAEGAGSAVHRQANRNMFR